MTLSVSERLEGGRRILQPALAPQPLVSIITVVFRDGAQLQPLMKSVFEQVQGDVEIIVIDGGSNDGTVEMLREWDGKIDYWLSESDRGIYNAMNKGIAAARGEYVLHLNAGDRLRLIPYAKLRKCAADGIDVVCFSVLMDGKDIYRPRMGLIMKVDNSWHHQGTFYRRTHLTGYDERYRICGDFDLNQRLIKAGRSIKIFDDIVADHANNGISSDPIGRREVYRIIRTNFGRGYLPIALLRFKLNSIRTRAKGMWKQLARTSA
jgi:glycosyltransferase involved in cell wall biosynthesis